MAELLWTEHLYKRIGGIVSCQRDFNIGRMHFDEIRITAVPMHTLADLTTVLINGRFS